MKLDYLQFLELEVFTRFGARLEASMERSIRRGRVLREILKQDRLAPLPIEFELAWMVAYNDDRFDDAGPEEIPQLLERLAAWCAQTELSLSSPREQWSLGVAAALPGNNGS